MKPTNKQELDQLIVHMKQNGASNQAMRAVVDDFQKSQSPTVSALMPFVENFMSSEQGQSLQATKTRAREAGVDINKRRDEFLRQKELEGGSVGGYYRKKQAFEDMGFTPEQAEEAIAKSLPSKIRQIPSKAMEGAEQGYTQREDIKAREAELEAKGEDFASRLKEINPEELPVAERPAAYNAKVTGWIMDKLNDLGTEMLPYTKPIKMALYDQFVDPAIESVIEAKVLPTGKPGEAFQSLEGVAKDVGTLLKTVSPEALDQGLKDVGGDIGSFIKENPDIALELEKTGATVELIRPIIDAFITRGLLKSLPKAFENLKLAGREVAIAGEEAFGPTASKVGQGIESTLSKTVEKITKPKFVTKRNDLAESMMNSLIKVDPARGAEHFYKLTKNKQTMGNFLLERDIIGTPEQVIEKLSERFVKVKRAFDDTIASIEGKYKFNAANTILEDMEERFIKTLDKKNLSRVKELRKKYNSGGLTMSENLELKRMYERKVKTGYLKDNNSELVDRATNLDSELRNEFMSTAEAGGFINASELSKEIQLIKAAMDSIESKAIRRLVNNQFSLTDNLLLVGGAINPSSLAVLGVKKIAGSPSVQAKMIRALSTPDIKTMKEIPGIPTDIINTKNAEKRLALYEQWLEETGLKGIIEETSVPQLTAPGSIQAGATDDIIEARGKQFREGTGVFEDQRSVKESTIPKTKMTNNSSIDDSIPDFNQGAIPPTKWIKDAKANSKTLVVDSDEIKKTLPGYTDAEAPRFHAESSKKAKELYAEALKDPAYDNVIIMGGGSGSGKSEVFVNKNLDSPKTIIFDGTMAKKAEAQAKIDQAIAAGKNVRIQGVMAPIEDAFYFATDRGRYVPRDVFVDKHYGFRKSIYELAKDNPELKVDIILNSKDKTYSLDFSSRDEMLSYLKSEIKSKEVIDNLVTKELAEKSLDVTLKDGGITISREGVQPSKGFAFAPSKTTEVKIPKKMVNAGDIEGFMKKYSKELGNKEVYFGAWIEGDEIYFDLSKVVNDKKTAIDLASKAEQEAVFNLESFETIYLE